MTPFIPSRCALIDTVGSNVLIRGNLPLTGPDNHYAFDEIHAASGVTDLPQRTFFDFPIIDNVGERAPWSDEVKSFGIDPDNYPISYWPPYFQPDYDPRFYLGSTLTTEGYKLPAHLIWWPFEGLPAGEDPQVYLGSPGWNYAGFIDNIIEMLSSLKNCALYVHCMLGADRTGAFHIGYLMRSKGMRLEQASRIANASTSAGAPNADYQRLVEAYAASLGLK